MDKVTALALTVVVAVLVGGFVAITLTHNATQDYLILLAGPAVSGVLGALILKKGATVAADVKAVKVATNGMLTARLTDIQDTLAAASTERQDIAAAAPQVQEDHQNGNGPEPSPKVG